MEKVEFGKALFHIKTQTCVILIKQNVKREINAITRSQNKWKFLKTIWDYYMALLLQFYRGETEAQRSRLHQIVSHRLRLASVPGTSRSDLSGTLLRAGSGVHCRGPGVSVGINRWWEGRPLQGPLASKLYCFLHMTSVWTNRQTKYKQTNEDRVLRKISQFSAVGLPSQCQLALRKGVLYESFIHDSQTS